MTSTFNRFVIFIGRRILRQSTLNAYRAFIIVYLTDGVTPHLLELTWLRDWDKDHYDLGDDEFHLAFTVEDYDSALKKHKEMGCVAMENEAMGIYFITDPDEYWLEILPAKR